MTISKLLLDSRNQKLLAALLKNPRASITDLARKVGLSAPATRERMLRLEEAGVITGWRVELDPKALGFPIAVRVRVRERTGRVIDTTITDNEGRFLFELPMAGSFFVEVVDESGKVLAVEDVGQVAVTVGPGHSSSTILRLPTRLTGAWKDAVAPTILGAAAAAGIGTFVASGQPASPER